MMRVLRRHGAACLLALLALLAAGCEARLQVDVLVDAEGAGTLTVGLAADAALRSEVRARGVDPLDDLAATGQGLEGEGWVVSDARLTDGGREVRLSATFAGPEEFNELTAALAGALAAPEVVLLDHLRLEVTPDVVRLEGAAGLVPTPSAPASGTAVAEMLDRMTAERAFVYEFVVTMQGELLETTATHRDGDRLRWRVEPGESLVLVAVAERPRSETWVIVVSGSAGGLVALLLGLALTRRRRRRRRRLHALRARSAASWR